MPPYAQSRNRPTVPDILASIDRLSETERCDLIDQLCAGNWGVSSDIWIDTFHDALNAMDHACAQYGRIVEDRVQGRAFV